VRCFLACLGFVLAGLGPTVLDAEPWKKDELIEAADLAKQIEARNAPTIICVTFPILYRQKHIRGAKYAGPGNKPDGIKDLEALAVTLSTDAEVVLYCGCCPMKDCPNIRPAYQTMKHLGFKVVRVLNIPNNIHNDWTAKGYPAEPLPAARTV